MHAKNATGRGPRPRSQDPTYETAVNTSATWAGLGTRRRSSRLEALGGVHVTRLNGSSSRCPTSIAYLTTFPTTRRRRRTVLALPGCPSIVSNTASRTARALAPSSIAGTGSDARFSQCSAFQLTGGGSAASGLRVAGGRYQRRNVCRSVRMSGRPGRSSTSAGSIAARLSTIVSRDRAARLFHFMSTYSAANSNQVGGDASGSGVRMEAAKPAFVSKPSPSLAALRSFDRNESASALVVNVSENSSVSTRHRTWYE